MAKATKATITLIQIPGEGYIAQLDTLDGKMYCGEYLQNGVHGSSSGVSATEALRKLADNWESAGFLE